MNNFPQIHLKIWGSQGQGIFTGILFLVLSIKIWIHKTFIKALFKRKLLSLDAYFEIGCLSLMKEGKLVSHWLIKAKYILVLLLHLFRPELPELGFLYPPLFVRLSVPSQTSILIPTYIIDFEIKHHQLTLHC